VIGRDSLNKSRVTISQSPEQTAVYASDFVKNTIGVLLNTWVSPAGAAKLFG
jgi:hypothetical protein